MKITGVQVRETVPDSVLEPAHAIQQMQAYRREQGIEQTWAAAEPIIVAVSPSPYSARLVRAARRMAAALHAHWFAVYVEPRSGRRPSQADSARLEQNLRLAAQLGAEVVTLSGDDATDEILRFSRERNITKIIVGEPVLACFRDRFRVSLVDRIVRQSGDVDVYVNAGDVADEPLPPEKGARRPLPVLSFVSAALVTGLSSAGAWLLFGRGQLADVVMIYLLGILWVSSRYGMWPSVFAAFLAVESGAVNVQKEWQSLEEVVGSALGHVERRLAGRSVHVDLPESSMLVPLDAVLIEQALINLLENSAKYGAGPIDISARAVPGEAQIEVPDRAPGIPLSQPTQSPPA